MSFVQYEVWGTLDGHEELVECVATLKEAEALAELNRELHDEVWIIQDTDDELKEVRRYQGL
jgi:hypothetical protein